jgi:hypothetical protein
MVGSKAHTFAFLIDAQTTFFAIDADAEKQTET